MIHELKIEKNYLQRLLEEKKKAEIRFNDRDYQRGDKLKFYNVTRRVIPGDSDFWVFFEITHVYSGVGMAQGYVCLSLKRIESGKEKKANKAKRVIPIACDSPDYVTPPES